VLILCVSSYIVTLYERTCHCLGVEDETRACIYQRYYSVLGNQADHISNNCITKVPYQFAGKKMKYVGAHAIGLILYAHAYQCPSSAIPKCATSRRYQKCSGDHESVITLDWRNATTQLYR